MKESLKLIIFVLIMGAISALVLIGADALTKERIEANKLFEFQQTVLRANGESLDGNISEQFYNLIEERKSETGELLIYVHKTTKNISFRFEGNGLWDKIKGIMTLKDDWKTIVDVTITDQGETPGLGALVAERKFLDTLNGKVFNPTITIKKDAEGASEVDTITGATGTSSQFQVILNNTYKKYYEAFIGELVLVDEEEMFEAILTAHGISTEGVTDLKTLFNENFKTFQEGNLKAYVNKTTARISFADIYTLMFGEQGDIAEEVMIVITLETDLKTVYKLQTLDDNNESHWGKLYLLTDKVLNKATGKTFPGLEFINKEATDPDKQIDGVSSATFTRLSFNTAINAMYDKYYEAFKEVDFGVNEDLTFYEKVLAFYNIEYEGLDVKKLFNEKFTKTISDGKELYENNETKEFVFSFVSEYTFGVGLDQKEELETIVILDHNFKTVVKLIVLHDNKSSHWGKVRFFTEEIMNNAIGKSFPNLTFVDEPTKENEIDGVTKATKTRDEFNLALNEAYNGFVETFFTLKLEDQKLVKILENNNIEFDLIALTINKELIKELISEHFNEEKKGTVTVYTNKVTGNVTYSFVATYSLGRNTPISEDLTSVITLNSDLKTIFKLSVIHDNMNGQWGKTQLFKQEILDNAIGKDVLTLEFIRLGADEVLEDNQVDGKTGATKTQTEFNFAIKEAYRDFYVGYHATLEADLVKVLLLLEANVYPGLDLDVDFNNTFETIEKEGLTLYKNKDNGNYSYTFEKDYSLGKDFSKIESLVTIVTLESDFETIVSLKVLHDNLGGWGKTRFFQTLILSRAHGKNISTIKFVNIVGDIVLGSGEVDGTATTTKTRDEFNEFLKETYLVMKDKFSVEVGA